MTPRPFSLRPIHVIEPYEPLIQAEGALDCSDARDSCEASCDALWSAQRMPKFAMPQRPQGDGLAGWESETPSSLARSLREPVLDSPEDLLAHTMLRYNISIEEVQGYISDAEESDGTGLLAGGVHHEPLEHLDLLSDFSASLRPAEEGNDFSELMGSGGVMAPFYYLPVCLGDRIPCEMGAARVNSSRLETGPEWRDFLHRGLAGDICDGVPMDTLLQCPCCLSVLRRPVGLPCGHSLCRGCLIRLPYSGPGAFTRRCPLCRAAVPRGRLHVNEQLDAVTEALHVYQAMSKIRNQSPQGLQLPQALPVHLLHPA